MNYTLFDWTIHYYLIGPETTPADVIFILFSLAKSGFTAAGFQIRREIGGKLKRARIGPRGGSQGGPVYR